MDGFLDKMHEKVRKQHKCKHPEDCCLDDLLEIIKKNVMQAFRNAKNDWSLLDDEHIKAMEASREAREKLKKELDQKIENRTLETQDYRNLSNSQFTKELKLELYELFEEDKHFLISEDWIVSTIDDLERRFQALE